jgi:hypothetical protein
MVRLRRNGLVAPFVMDGPMNGEAFRVYVEKTLVPTLQPDDIVAMDNRPPARSPARADLSPTLGPSCVCRRPTRPI